MGSNEDIITFVVFLHAVVAAKPSRKRTSSYGGTTGNKNLDGDLSMVSIINVLLLITRQ